MKIMRKQPLQFELKSIKVTPNSVPGGKKAKLQDDNEQLVTRSPYLGTLFNRLSQHPETISLNDI